MPEKIYVLNEETKLLHIKGLCNNSFPVNNRQFETENEAVRYAGMYIHICATCNQKRDEIIKAYIAETENKQK